MYGLYSFLLFLALLFQAPVHLWRAKFGRKENLYLRERLGLKLPPASPNQPAIWIHAVSVGEVLSLRRLIAEIKQRHPAWPVYFSTLTATGYRIAKSKLPDADAVFLVPMDFGWIVRRFFRALRPKLFILAESEFWPRLLREAARACRSVLLINGRISQRSSVRYRRLRFLSRPLLDSLDRFLVQTESDRQRLLDIGLPPDRIEVAGNLKADIRLPEVDAGERTNLRREIGIAPETRLIVAGSTHKGEEEMILKAFRAARETRPSLAIVIAPRHPERAPEVERIAIGLSLTVKRRTKPDPSPFWDVLLLDTLGELARFYALADLVFVGGSLVAHGGQNLLEPAFYGRPLIFGPHMDNFAFLADRFLREGGARVVRDSIGLRDSFLVADGRMLEEMGSKARTLLASFQGATDRTVRVIESLIGKESGESEERR